MKDEVPDIEDTVKALINSTDDTEKGTDPLCQEEEKNTAANMGCQVPKDKVADQTRGSRSSESEDEMLVLEALIQKIVKKGKRPAGEREASKVDVEDQTCSPSKPHEQSSQHGA